MPTHRLNTLLRRSSAAVAASLLVACAGPPSRSWKAEEVADPIAIDGRLDDACYGREPLARFVVASAPDQKPEPTRAWLFWNHDRFIVAFDCVDGDVVAQPASAREHDVDMQDRVELFLWSGRAEDPYACLEIGARGAVHDYQARFHRQFDDAWRATGLESAATTSATGFRVEAALPRALMDQLGFPLQAGTTLRVGLFRADLRSGAPGTPTWITWIDAALAAPDFHVAESFGTVVLAPAEEPKETRRLPFPRAP